MHCSPDLSDHHYVNYFELFIIHEGLFLSLSYYFVCDIFLFLHFPWLAVGASDERANLFQSWEWSYVGDEPYHSSQPYLLVVSQIFVIAQAMFLLF